MGLQTFDIQHLGLTQLEQSIEKMRLELSNLSWVTHAYGMAFSDIDANSGKREPFAYEGGDTRNYVNVKPDNDKAGMVFFMVSDEKADYDEDVLVFDIGIVFQVNLNLIDSSRLDDHLFTEELITEARRTVREKFRGLGFYGEYKGSTRKFSSVYREFTPFEDRDETHLEETQNYHKAPCQVFRLNMRLSMHEDC